MNTNSIFTPGTLEVLSLANAKKQLRIESSFTEEDDLIQSYIDAAVVAAENFIGGHILPGSLVLSFDKFDNPVIFEAFPLKSVTSVKYFANEVEETLDVEKYQLTVQHGKVYKLQFRGDLPTTDKRFDAVTITVDCGFAGNAIPKPIVQAIKLMVADMYEIREDRKEVISTAAMSLLRPYKKF
jgi:uncharacterized phiE125 gp8 family phage protein